MGRMTRKELLKLCVEQEREIARLAEELKQAESELADRRLKVGRAGTMAEAALALSGIFEAADEAAARYIEGAKALCGQKRPSAGARAIPQVASILPAEGAAGAAGDPPQRPIAGRAPGRASAGARDDRAAGPRSGGGALR